MKRQAGLDLRGPLERFSTRHNLAPNQSCDPPLDERLVQQHAYLIGMQSMSIYTDFSEDVANHAQRCVSSSGTWSRG